jgi:hypothetical protein
MFDRLGRAGVMKRRLPSLSGKDDDPEKWDDEKGSERLRRGLLPTNHRQTGHSLTGNG